MEYIGDYAEDATVDIFFTTSDKDGGAVAPSSALEAADIIIYKGNSATQKTATDGITMTSPFDSITGLHQVSIDTSNDTNDAGFWETGYDYTVILSPDETVDTETVVKVLAQFSIENRTSFPKEDYPTNFSAMGIESDGDLTKVNTLDGHTAQTGDNYARLGAPAGASVSADVAAVKAETSTIVTDTNELQTDWTDGGRLDLIVDAILADTNELQTDNIPGTLTTIEGKIDTIDGIVDSILVDTGTTIPAQIDGLNDPTAADVATAVMADTTVGGVAFSTVLEDAMAMLAGETTGHDPDATGTVVFEAYRNAGTDQLAITYDADQNRTLINHSP